METWVPRGRVWRERISEALEWDEVAKEKVKRLQRSPQSERSGRRHSEGAVRTKRDQITQSRKGEPGASHQVSVCCALNVFSHFILMPPPEIDELGSEPLGDAGARCPPPLSTLLPQARAVSQPRPRITRVCLLGVIRDSVSSDASNRSRFFRSQLLPQAGT